MISGDRVLNAGGLRYRRRVRPPQAARRVRRSLSRRRADHRAFPRRALGPCADPAAAGGAVRRPRRVVRDDAGRADGARRRSPGRTPRGSPAPEPTGSAGLRGRAIRAISRSRNRCSGIETADASVVFAAAARRRRVAAARSPPAAAAKNEAYIEKPVDDLYNKAMDAAGRGELRRPRPRPSTRSKASIPIRSGRPKAS